MLPGLTAVVLAGGEGTRLRPLTNDLPKPVLPVANRPFFEYMLDHLRSAGVARVIMALGYHAEQLIESFGDGSVYGLLIDYVVEDKPLGTSGAVRALLPELKETFLVLNGDCVTEVNIAAMVEQHVERREYATLAIHTVDDPSRYGVIVLDGIGYVSRFIEKPPRPTLSRQHRQQRRLCAGAGGVQLHRRWLLDVRERPISRRSHVRR